MFMYLSEELCYAEVKEKHMEKEPRQVPLGGLETDEEVVQEADRAAAEATQEDAVRVRTEEAMSEEGFMPTGDHCKKVRANRKEWLALREKLFKENKEKELF